MRLVGATEFFIRGPFYVEGLLQGLLGGLLASGALFGAYQLLHARGKGRRSSPRSWPLDFLSPRQVAFLILLGGAAGLFGAVASLRREASVGKRNPGPAGAGPRRSGALFEPAAGVGYALPVRITG